MKRLPSYEELVKKVQQQDDTIVQLVKILAATNHRVSELQAVYKGENVKSIPAK